MLNSYVGIASRDGLERLCPENPGVARFLAAQAARLRQQAVLVWAVLPVDAADDIMEELRAGEKRFALRLLQHAARDGGQLMTD
ncbi:MAG: hypothetical protein K2V38_26435 [Gemmataceae bacterium]|nr:hypothetical protein [Gemmataceae bacterium]